MNTLNEVKCRLPHIKCRIRKIQHRYEVKLSGEIFMQVHIGKVSLYISKPTAKVSQSMPFFSMWR
jgi:hypothetical protein